MRAMHRSPGEAGFSLVELLVSTGLGILILAIIVALVLGHAGSMYRLRKQAQALVDLHWAAERVAADLRATGLDPHQAAFPAPLRIGPHTFSRAADLDGDGLVDHRSREYVTFRVSNRGELMREVGRQRMALLAGLVGSGLDLRVSDEFGALLIEGVSPTEGAWWVAVEGQVARVVFSIDTANSEPLISSVALRWVHDEDSPGIAR